MSNEQDSPGSAHRPSDAVRRLGDWLDDTDFVETPEGFELDDDDPWSDAVADEVDLTDEQQAFLRSRRRVVISDIDFDVDADAILEEVDEIGSVDPER